MILKVMTDLRTDTYWMLDKISKINKAGVFLKSSIPQDDYYDITLFHEENEDQYVELICRGEDTSTEFCLVTDCVVYLLNDDGRTIGKILPKL